MVELLLALLLQLAALTGDTSDKKESDKSGKPTSEASTTTTAKGTTSTSGETKVKSFGGSGTWDNRD